jgi:hypothetical protein
VRGALDFQEDREQRVVVARARWALDTPSEVMRWYQLHANYLGARFGEPKDLVSINDDFDLTAKMAALWGSYRAKLHEKLVRFSVGVNSNARVRLTINTSGARYGIPTAETATLREAIAAIFRMREARENQRTISERLIRRLSSTQMRVGVPVSKKQSH